MFKSSELWGGDTRSSSLHAGNEFADPPVVDKDGTGFGLTPCINGCNISTRNVRKGPGTDAFGSIAKNDILSPEYTKPD